MPHKIHNLILAGLGVCLAMVPAMAHAPVLAVAGVAAVIAAAAVMVGARVLRRSMAFVDWTDAVRERAVGWMWVAAWSDVAMATALQVAGIRYWPVWLAGVCLLVAVQVGVAMGLEYLWRLPARSGPDEGEQTGPVPGGALVPDHTRTVVRSDRSWPELSRDEQHMTAALRTVQHEWLRVVGGGPLRDGDGRVFGARFVVRVPAAELAARGADKVTPSAQLAENLAIALSEQLGRPLESRWVSIRKDRAAGQWTITVASEDITARLYPYVEPAGPASVRQPACIGYGIDAGPVRLALEQHIRIIGQTRGGKTSLLHVLLAVTTLCAGNADIEDDAVLWLGGSVKMYDQLGGWLEVYQGSGLKMPFHWVAVGPDDVCQMLVALMVAARYRQSVPMGQRRWPAIICSLDEVSATLGDKGITVVYNGRKYTASKMAAMVAKAVGSARCWLHYGTQRGTNDEIGEEGGTIAAQTSAAFAFRNGDWADVSRVIGDWKIDPPVHQGETWVKGAYDADGPILSKNVYIQEVDPSKPVLHDGLTLADVSWSRRGRVAELDAGTDAAIAAAVPAYATRARVVDDAFMAYLSGVEPVRSAGPTGPDAGPMPGPVDQGADRWDGDLGDPAPNDVAAEVAHAAGQDLAAMTDADRRGFCLAVGIAMRERGVSTAAELVASLKGATTAPIVADAAPDTSRAEKVLQIVTAHPDVTSREIITKLREAGDPCPSEVAVHNLLKRLCGPGGSLRKDERRRFRVVEPATAGHVT